MVGSTHASLFTHRVHLNWTGTQNKKKKGGGGFIAKIP